MENTDHVLIVDDDRGIRELLATYLEKNGMRVVAIEEREYVCGRLPTEIWEITAEEWKMHRSR